MPQDYGSSLVSGHAEALARSIVLFKLGGARDTSQDVEDVCSDVLVRLLAVRTAGVDIGDVPAYVARTSYNACNEYFRQRFPQRHRLKVRLRKMLHQTPGFALWHDAGHGWLCGADGWQGRTPLRCVSLSVPGSSRQPEQLLGAVFAQLAGPLELDHLVDLVADAWGVSKHQLTLDSVAARLGVEPVVSEAKDQRLLLERIWTEIRELPIAQRHALLLNLRAPEGAGALKLFPLTGVASFAALSAALQIPAPQFAAVWYALPLDDATIAGRLGLTRQQVINLRKAARKRLARRMRMPSTSLAGRTRTGFPGQRAQKTRDKSFVP